MYKKIGLIVFVLWWIGATYYYVRVRGNNSEQINNLETSTECPSIKCPDVAVCEKTECAECPKQNIVKHEIKRKQEIYFSFNGETALNTNDLNFFVEQISEYIKTENSKKYTILISSHTCYMGPAKINKKIAEERALYIENILINAGINKNLIKKQVFGEKHAEFSNKTSEGRAKNRRVVISFEEE